MSKNIVLNNLTIDQLRRIVQARRSLPIPNMARAGSVAREKFYKQKDGHEIAVMSQNGAIKLCRDAGLTEALAIVTVQSVCEDYVVATNTRAQLSEEDYDLLTFSVRAVLDPDSVPARLRDYLTTLKPPPEQPAPQATAGHTAVQRGRRRPAPAKPPRASKAPKQPKPEDTDEDVFARIFE